MVKIKSLFLVVLRLVVVVTDGGLPMAPPEYEDVDVGEYETPAILALVPMSYSDVGARVSSMEAI